MPKDSQIDPKPVRMEKSKGGGMTAVESGAVGTAQKRKAQSGNRHDGK